MTTNTHLYTIPPVAETIVSTDAIEQLNPYVPGHRAHSKRSPTETIRGDYWWSSVSAAQKSVTAIPLILSDLLALIGSNFAVAAGIAVLFGRTVHPNYVWQGIATALVYLGVGALKGLYPGTAVSPVYEFKHAVTNCWLAFGTTLALNRLLATLSFYELVVGIGAAALASLVVPLMRSISRNHFSKYNWWGERLIVIGSGAQGQAIYRFYRRSPHRGLKPVGLVDSDKPANSQKPLIRDPSIPYLGSINNLQQYAEQHRANWAIVAPGGCDGLNLSQVVKFCGVFHNLVILPTDVFLPSLWSNTRECAGVMGVHVYDHLRRPLPRVVKRLSDIIGACIALVVFSPVFVLAAIWLKIKSPGPIFYGQERIGRDGRPFTAWKFRTMATNADEILEHYLESDFELRQEWMTYQKLRNDPRIIPRVGYFLRQSSMDELPQLLNVILGDMSLVGPRPCMKSQIEFYKETFPLYLRVRPGITGLWQISGRNETSYEQRVRFDGYYVCNWSLWLDAYILLRTFKTILLREGAF